MGERPPRREAYLARTRVGFDFKLDGLALSKAAEALGVNLALVNEHVVLSLDLDEPESLLRVEPLRLRSRAVDAVGDHEEWTAASECGRTVPLTTSACIVA